MTKITISLLGANLDEITLETEGSQDYILGKEVMGFGLPPVNVNIAEGAGDGGRYISTRRLPRDIDLPIYIFGNDRSEVETKLRRLTNLISDRSGPTTLRVVYDTTPETSFFIEGYYMGGAEIQHGEGSSFYTAIALQLRCPQPFWQSESFETFVLTGAEITDVSIANTGDIETFIVWNITGDLDAITLSNANGSLSYESPVLATETIIIDTASATCKDSTGVNKYANLGAKPKMFAIPAGTTIVNIEGTNVSPTATVTGSFRIRREIVF